MWPLFAHVPVIFVTGPSDDWCSIVEEAEGGDIVLFEPGRYTSGCNVVADVPDKPGERTVLQSFDPDDIAVFEPPATGEPALSVQGDLLILLQLSFEGGEPGQAYVAAGDIEELTVRWTSMGPGSATGLQQTGPIGLLEVENAWFEGIPTSLDLQCDGCGATTLRVDNSVFVGGGLTLGAATAEVEDVFVDTPGIALQSNGTLDLHGSVLKGATALASSAESQVRNTFLLGDPLAAEVTAPSTFMGVTAQGALSGPLSIRASALDQDAPADADLQDSVVCIDPAACWVDVSTLDFTPQPGGPLEAAGGPASTELATDWCRESRNSPTTAGALETPATPGPLLPGYRDQTACEGGEEPGDTSEPQDTGEPPPSTGCGGCHSTSSSSTLGGWWLALWAVLYALGSRLSASARARRRFSLSVSVSSSP